MSAQQEVTLIAGLKLTFSLGFFRCGRLRNRNLYEEVI